MAGDKYNQFGTGSFGGGFGNRRGNVESQATLVSNNVRDLYEQNFNGQHGSASHLQAMNGQVAEHRRVAAAQGADLVQKYDAFGNNSFSSADNPWAAFFGSPATPWKTTSYDKYDRHNYNLPDAYVGKSETLTATVDELIYSDENYYTSVLLPMSFTDQLHINWDRWEFNEHFTGIIPEQGVSRLVSSHRESRSESFIRRGLAAIWEHGFMSTPEGRANYFLTLAQIARACQETIRFGVVYAYLTCQNYTKQWQEKHGYFRKDTLKQLLQRQNFMWGIVVKTEFGMEKLDAQIVEWMNDHRSSADTWLLPPKPAMFLRLVPIEKTHYYIAGQEGPDRVNNILGAGRPHESNAPGKRTQDIVEPYAVFKKNNVYLTRCYHVDKTGPIDLMVRTASSGEYFKILPAIGSTDYRNDYHTTYLDTRIFDEDNDTGFTVVVKEALRHCQVFKEDGSPNNLPNMVDQPDSMDLKECFFLRSVMNAEGIEQFVPISYLGDIDAAFFRSDDAANWAATAVRSAFPDKAERDRLAATINRGMAEIKRRNMASLGNDAAGNPIDATAGRTAWDNLNGAGAPVELTDLRAAVETVTERMALIVGNQDNLFLKADNSFAAAPGQGSAAQTLYENFINAGTVPVYTVDQTTGGQPGGGAAGATASLYTNAHRLIVGTISNGTGRSVAKQAELVALRARVAAGGDLNVANRDNTIALLNIIDADPVLSGAASIEDWRSWSAELRGKLAAGAANVPVAVNPRTGQDVVLRGFVSRKNPSLADGSAANVNIFPASKWDLRRPTDAASYGGEVELLGEGFMETSPIALASVGAELSGEVGRNNKPGFQQRVGGGYRGDLQDLFDDGDDEPIGTMFGAGEKRNRNVAGLDANARWTPDLGGFELRGDETFNMRFGNMGRNIDALAKTPMDPIARLMASLYYGAPWHRDTLDNFLDHNMLCPVGFLGFRVGLYQMALGIKCKAGAETGRTYFGHSSFMLADDAAVGVHYGNFHHYGKSVIHNDNNVFVAYDIFPNACLGGMGTRPYTSAEQYQPADAVFGADIFYVMVPYRETTFDSVMSMAGRFYTYLDRGMLDDDDPANRALHYSTAAYYNRVWKWYSEENVQVELDEPMYRMTNAAQDLTVWQGAQGTYNPDSRKFDKNIIRNKGLWGPNVAEGCKASRDGQMERVPIVPLGVLGF